MPPAPGTTPDGGGGNIFITVSAVDCPAHPTNDQDGELPGLLGTGLDPTPYVVNWLPDRGDCMIPTGIEIGTILLINGAGSGAYKIPPVANTGINLRPTPFSGHASVCVAQPGSTYSIQAPITVV